MATNFPASLDTLTNPSATDTLDSPPHDEQHADANDAIEALQAKVGVDSSAVTTSLDYRVGQLEAGGGGMTVSSTAPSSPVEGDMWYDDTSGRTYVYYDDGSSQQWVEFGAPPSGIGKILQVVSAVKTDTQSASLGADVFADITDLNISLTCSSASNKVLMVGSIAGGWSANNNNDFRWRFTAGGTAVGIGGAAGNRIPVTSFMYGQGAGVHTQTVMFLYSPSSTSAITYSVQFGHAGNGTYTAYVNRGIDYTDTRANHTYISTLTVMEVAA